MKKRPLIPCLCVLLFPYSCDSGLFNQFLPSPTPSPDTTASPSPMPSPSPDATTSASPLKSPSPTPTPTPTPGTDFFITLSFQGPATSSNTVYVAWIEDDAEDGEDSENLQNLYVCNKLIAGGLTGTSNPYWKREKYPGSSVDGVTGASIQGTTGLSVTRSLDIGSVRKFRVCFEIDRSWNNNTTFNDRPAFTYRSGTIDLDDLQSQYDLSLYGWMSNDTSSSSLCQWPKTGITIPDWAVWQFMKDVSWLTPNYDMVSTLRIVVTPE